MNDHDQAFISALQASAKAATAGLDSTDRDAPFAKTRAASFKFGTAMKAARVQIPRKLYERVLFGSGQRCWFCGDIALEVDHLMPVSRGGTNDEGNLVPTCHECNDFKRTRTLDEFRKFLGVKRFYGEGWERPVENDPYGPAHHVPGVRLLRRKAEESDD